ncbi:MAG: hypothetical protein HQK87_09035 [Nitrospinae bacterium]|nr:hypothetical protein [Nitrospinota bacterium]
MKRLPMNPMAELAFANAHRAGRPIATDLTRHEERRYQVMLPAKKDDTHTLMNRLSRRLSRFVPRHRKG